MVNKIPFPVRATIGIILLAIVGLYAVTTLQDKDEGPLSASGTVEGLEISIAPELAGKVISVPVGEGLAVNIGDVLLNLDGTILNAQRGAALASLDSAIASKESAELAVELAEVRYQVANDKAQGDARALRTSEIMQPVSNEYQQPEWYFDLNETYSALLNTERTALDQLAKANADLELITSKVSAIGFIESEQNLNNSRSSFEAAREVFNKLTYSGADQILIDQAQRSLDQATLALEIAERNYSDSLTTEGAADVLEARAKLQVAQQYLDLIQIKVLRYKTGDHSSELKIAEIGLNQAQAQVVLLEKAIAIAEANLALIDAQIAKLTIKSPISAIVQTRNVEIGEVVNPGTVVFSLTDLKNLTLKVYVTEDRYGEVFLNQKVEIRVDSFPDKVFEGQVTRIADQAEFTPRNVQTVDGRKTTVFAILIHINELEGLIKPGMPADVIFIK